VALLQKLAGNALAVFEFFGASCQQGHYWAISSSIRMVTSSFAVRLCSIVSFTRCRQSSAFGPFSAVTLHRCTLVRGQRRFFEAVFRKIPNNHAPHLGDVHEPPVAGHRQRLFRVLAKAKNSGIPAGSTINAH
jgi:hypothetical protein